MILNIPLLAAAAAAGGLPDVDDPLRSGASAPGDAAVVIGIEDYAFVADVPHAARDAQAVYDLLVSTVGVPPANVRLLDRGASRELILEAVDAARAQVSGKGTLWVYFAGHGAADPATGKRLVLGDDVRGDATSTAARGVPLESLSGVRTVLMVDACYGGVGRAGEELISGKRFVVPAYAVQPTSAALLEWNAASPNELAGPLEGARHGAFTYFAIGALRGWADGEVDGRRDGSVTAAEAQLFVQRALREVQIADQHPVLVGTNTSGWVLVTRAAEPRPQLRPPTAGSWPAPAQGEAGVADPATLLFAKRFIAGEMVDTGVDLTIAQRWTGSFRLEWTCGPTSDLASVRACTVYLDGKGVGLNRNQVWVEETVVNRENELDAETIRIALERRGSTCRLLVDEAEVLKAPCTVSLDHDVTTLTVSAVKTTVLSVQVSKLP